jgi:hypothetical protein
MTTQPDQNECPATILAWIPWYPDGLDAEQSGAVESHAAACRECRRELTLLLGDETDPGAVPDPERVYATVLARIESDNAGSGAAGNAAEPFRRATVRAPRGEPRRLATSTRSGGSWRTFALAASAALALLVGGMVGAFLTRTAEPVYRTASGPADAVSPAGGVVEVVFREHVEMDRITETLRAMGAEITSGPSQLGVYRVELRGQGDGQIGGDVGPSAAAKLLRGDRDGVAIFAEPGRP